MYPSLAKKFYAEDKTRGHPFDAAMMKSIASLWPLRKPKDESSTDAPGSNINNEMIKTCVMTLMKMVQGQRLDQEPKIDFYDGRPMTSALNRRPSFALEDRMAEPVRTAGMKHLALGDEGDAIGDAALKDFDKDVDKADGAPISLTKPKYASVDKGNGIAAREEAASILQAL